MSIIVECIICSRTGSIRSGLISVDEGENGTQKRVWERSLQDLIAIFLPYMDIATNASIGLCFFYDPTMNFLLYSGLPGGYKNWLTFCLCMMEEDRILMMWAAIVVPMWQLQVMAFDLVNNVLKQVEAFLNR